MAIHHSRVPTSNGIKKRLFIRVLELQIPGLTAVGGFVDPRAFAVADAQDVSGVGVKGLDVAEIEFLGTGHGHYRPMLSAVDRLDNRSAGPARPDDFFTDDRQPAKTGGCVDRLFDPLSRGKLRGNEKRYDK